MGVKSGDVLIQRKAGISISVTIVLDDGITATTWLRDGGIRNDDSTQSVPAALPIVEL